MKKGLRIIGILCLAYVLLSWVLVLLPAGFWQMVSNSLTPNTYYKIMPNAFMCVQSMIFIAIGLALIALSFFIPKQGADGA